WTQFYIRQLDSVNQGGMKKVVDTLFIQYFDITGIDVASYVYQGNPVQHYYGQPKRANYKPATRLNSGALRTDTILLDDSWADSVSLKGANTQFFGRGVQLKVGLNSKSTNTTPIYNNVFAWAITFKPMVKTALGDTLIAYNGSVPSKKYNMFGIRMASQDQHDQQLNSPYKVNNSFITNFEVLGGKAVGIFQAYLPGTVFNNSIFIPHFIHISTSNLSTQNVRANTLTGATVYPNPASANTSVDVVFNLGSVSQVTARIVDINGREVKAFDSKACVAGQNMMNLDIAGITKGMYLVVLESAAGKTTTKLNVQ
ncbi:MAG: T9SS type A sorting domain-containing protein, partial [Bacteroidia bacterium]|nr:T9SS type A sorting domain-containing protein [Bacteroidia bacterium]